MRFESIEGVSRASDVEQVPMLAISKIHSSAQTDHEVVINAQNNQFCFNHGRLTIAYEFGGVSTEMITQLKHA